MKPYKETGPQQRGPASSSSAVGVHSNYQGQDTTLTVSDSNLATTGQEEHLCLNCGKVSDWRSPTGHYGCLECKDLIAYAVGGIPGPTEQYTTLYDLKHKTIPPLKWSIETILV